MLCKSVLIIISIILLVFIVNAEENMLGPGHYIVERIYTCENEDKYPVKMNVYKHKLNRTHDVYDAEIQLNTEINDHIAILGEVFVLVDGGYKPYYADHYKCGCCFIRKYAKENFEKILTMAGIDPPDCPIPKGYHNVTGFMFDNNELPNEGVYGEYKVKCTFKSILNEELACLMMNINFYEDE